DLLKQLDYGRNVELGVICAVVGARPYLETLIVRSRIGPLLARRHWRGRLGEERATDGRDLRVGEDALRIRWPDQERLQFGPVRVGQRLGHNGHFLEYRVVAARYAAGEFIRHARQAQRTAGPIDKARDRVDLAVLDGLVDQR